MKTNQHNEEQLKATPLTTMITNNNDEYKKQKGGTLKLNNKR